MSLFSKSHIDRGIDMDFMQQGDKSILTNVGKTVLVLTAFMFAIIIAANVLT